MRARPRRRDDRLPARGRDRPRRWRRCSASASCAGSMDIARRSRGGDRRGARRRQRPAVPRAGGAGDRLRDRPARRPARGAARRRSASSSSIHEPPTAWSATSAAARSSLTDIAGGKVGRGVTLPLGGLSLIELSERSPKKAAQDRARRARQGQGARRSRRPDLLRRRRHLARAGAPAHAPAPISDARDAQLRHPDPRRAGIRQAGRAHRGRGADLDRDGVGRPPAAARLWRGGARGDHPPLATRARSSSRRSGVREGLLFEGLSPEEQAQDPLIAAARQFNLLALARARRTPKNCSTGRASFSARPISRRRRRRRGCATPPACSPTSPGAPIPTIAANSRTTSSPTPPSSASTIPSRAYLALAASYRHVSGDQEVSPHARSLVSPRQLDRARVARRGDARRLHRLGGDARRAAARADGGAAGPASC